MPIEPIREMINVGVTAKLASPLYHLPNAIPNSSTDTDNTLLYSKYKKFLDENTSTPSEDTLPTTSDNSKTLYKLKSINEYGRTKITPTKMEFLLYRKSQRNKSHQQRQNKRVFVGKTPRPKNSQSSIKRLLESESKSEEIKLPPTPAVQPADVSLVGKLKKSFASKKPKTETKTKTPKDSRIDIYPFDHGCAEYLRTTDFAPQIISELLAQRATDYATRFWAEVFGSLHIGVAFFLTFFLQTYRFLLHSVVKSVVVGFLQMTSDYGVKPLLTVIFNGFLQPCLIFMHNTLSSVRDVLQPVSETLNNFLKPLSGLLRSIRLAAVKINHGKGQIKDYRETI